MARERVIIKGTSKGVIITLGPGDWQSLLQQVAVKLNQRASFFKGGRVALSVGHRLLDAQELEAFGRLLSEHHMTLWAVHTEAAETRAAAESLGLETELDAGGTASHTASPSPAENTLTLHRTLRSGQSVEYPGNVVLIGDVNPGAKISAGGYVIIWGRLRGTVHAGLQTGEEAFVCALELAPMQLVIGATISRSPTDDHREGIMPEMAFVQDGHIVAEAWR